LFRIQLREACILFAVQLLTNNSSSSQCNCSLTLRSNCSRTIT